jgi:hypothetical protein
VVALCRVPGDGPVQAGSAPAGPTREDRLAEAVVGDTNIEGGRGSIRVDPKDGENAIDIAE